MSIGQLLRHLAQNKNIFVKLSEVAAARIEETGGPNFYRERLDALWDIFGEDHVLYASDWPNSGDHHATYKASPLCATMSSRRAVVVAEKFFWKNSLAAYHWQHREADQPGT